MKIGFSSAKKDAVTSADHKRATSRHPCFISIRQGNWFGITHCMHVSGVLASQIQTHTKGSTQRTNGMNPCMEYESCPLQHQLLSWVLPYLVHVTWGNHQASHKLHKRLCAIIPLSQFILLSLTVKFFLESAARTAASFESRMNQEIPSFWMIWTNPKVYFPATEALVFTCWQRTQLP
jgi:hypothetical protein